MLTAAINKHNSNNIKEGNRWIQGLPILIWKYCAEVIKKAISKEGINTNSEYQMPANKRVANTIFEAPTELRIKLLRPNWLNSFSTLWKRKVQTYTIEIATMAWAKIEYWFIFIIDFKSRRHFFLVVDWINCEWTF